jgi:hypothetical protein
MTLGASTAPSGAGTLAFAVGGAGQATIAGNLTLGSGGLAGNLTMTNGGTLTLAGFTSSTVGTFTRGTGTVILTGTNTLPSVAAYNTFNNLSVSANTTTLSQNLTVAGNLAITGGTMNTNAFTLAVSGNASVSGALTLTNTTTITGTTIVGGTLSITSATGNKTFVGDVTINGTWSNSVAGNIFLQGNLADNGTFTSGNATYNFTGTAAQTISGTTATTSFVLVTLSNATGLSLTGSHNVTVTTLLTLSAGKIATNANTLYISNGSNISGATTGRFVEGNLKKPFSSANLTRTFEVGGNTGANYSPVSITFASITTGGDITVRSTAGSHAQLGTSGLDMATPSKLNRWWTITNGGVAFTNYSATFTFVATEVDPAPTNATAFLAMRYDGVAWNPMTLPSAPTTTSITIGSETGFGDVAVGEPAGYNVNQAGSVGRFNAYDPPPVTATNSVQGFIRTKTAGVAFTLRIVHLDTTGLVLLNLNKESIRVDLLDGSVNTGGTYTAGNNCYSLWTVIATVNTAFPSNTTQMDVTFDPATVVAIRNSYPNVRVKVTRTSGGTDTGCSGDRFAIKPADMVVQAYDTNWQTAGTNPATDRILNNGSATTGNVHAASTLGASTPRPFTLRATARNGAGTPITATNYAGTPTVKSGSPACALPIGCATGTLSVGAWTPASGVVSAPAHYGEAGTFNLELEDLTFAAVDTADTTLSVRRIGQTSAPLLVGRFVPDRFALTAAITPPQLQTFGASCAATRSFTYVGKPFWYATPPSATVQALNAGGAVTSNYRGTGVGGLFRLVASGITETYSNNSVGPALSCTLSDLTTACGPANGPAPSVVAGATALTFGTGTYTAASAGGVLTYARGATHPPTVSPYNAKISLSVVATDSSENGVAGNPGNGATPTLTTPSPLVFDGGGPGIAFDGSDFDAPGGLTAGKTFVYGIARLDYVTGPENVDHPVLLQAQYWNGTSFARNTQDNCTSFIPKNFVLSNHLGALNATNMVSPTGATDGNVSISGNLNSGFANLKVAKPTSVIAAPGSVRICLDLDSAAGTGDTSCQAATPAAKGYLQGRWTLVNYDKDPFSTVGFGIYGAQPRNFIYFRENY